MRKNNRDILNILNVESKNGKTITINVFSGVIIKQISIGIWFLRTLGTRMQIKRVKFEKER